MTYTVYVIGGFSSSGGGCWTLSGRVGGEGVPQSSPDT